MSTDNASSHLQPGKELSRATQLFIMGCACIYAALHLRRLVSKHALVIFNPSAKAPVPVEEWMGRVVQKLNEHDEYTVKFHPTEPETKPEDLVPLFQPPLDLIIAAGGDGTVRFVLAALAQAKSDIPAAIFPFGTGNVLARNLGILQENFFGDPLEQAFEFIVRGQPMRIDLGMMNEEYFAALAGVGPMAEAFMKPDRAAKSKFKVIAYVKALLESVTRRPQVFKITVPGKSFTVHASAVFVTNVEEVGIGKPADVGALTNGLLGLHVVNPRHFTDYVKVGFRFTGTSSGDSNAQYTLQINEAVVEVMPSGSARSAFQKFVVKLRALFTGSRSTDSHKGTELPCMIDGEECGVAPMRVSVVPQVVNVLVPPAKHKSSTNYSEADARVSVEPK